MQIHSRQILFSLLLLLSCSAFSQQKDSLFLYKGQTLIGDIKNAELGVITIDDVDLKIITTKLYKIKRIKTSHRFRIETSDKRVIYGTLQTTSRDGYAEISTDENTKITIAITDISSMVFLERNFLRRLDGNVGAGFSYSKSSEIGQVNFNAKVSYYTEKVENQLKISTIGSIDSSKYSRDNESAELFTNYNFNSSWIAAGLLAYQRNLELSLARRFQELFGGGNKLLVRKNMELLAMTGISLSQERSTDDIASGLLLEIPVIVRFDFYNFHHPNIQVSSSQSIYFGITETGRVRYSGSTDFAWELVHNFSFTLNLYSNFDSRPPDNSGNKTDFGIVMGFSYKF